LQEYEKTKATDKSDLKSTSFPNTETECKNDKKAEAADQTAVRNTSVVEDYDDFTDSLLNWIGRQYWLSLSIIFGSWRRILIEKSLYRLRCRWN
jgi:hypothetical protein